MSPRRRRRRFPLASIIRTSLATLLVVALVAGLAVGAVLLLFDPAAYKDDIEAAAHRATGRTLALNGPMRLGIGLPPRLIAEDVTLSNPPGASRPQMLTLERAEARVAIWPLLGGHVTLTDLTLIHPDLELERDATGRGNWLMAPLKADKPEAVPAPAPVATGDAPPVSPLAQARPMRSRIEVQSIHVDQGRIGWRLNPESPVVEIVVPRIDAIASGPGGTMLLSGVIRSEGRNLRLSGEIGPPDRLADSSVALPWPYRASLRDGAAHVSVMGAIAQPLRGKGVALTLEAGATDFTGIDPFLPAGFSAPRDATLTLRWGDGGIDDGVGLAGLSLHIGGIFLPSLLPGLDVRHIDIAAPGLDRPVHADVEANSPSLGPLRLVANAGSLGGLLPGAHPADAVPIEVTLDAGRALLSAKGLVAEPAARKGVDLDVFVRLPDVAAFGTLAGRPLPPLHEVAFEGHLSGDLDGVGGLGVRRATLTLPQAQFAGEFDLRPGKRPFVRAAVTAQRVDLDSLIAALSVLWHPADPAAAPPDLDAPPAPPAPVDVPVEVPDSTPPAEPARRLIPDSPINVAWLDRFDADLDLHMDSVLLGGGNASQVGGHAALHDGALVVDRLGGITPGGPAQARFSIDSRAAGPPMALSVRIPSLQLAQLAGLLPSHPAVNGSVALAADLHGAGRSPHALAASLDGHVGVGASDGDIDNDLLLSLLHGVGLPDVPLAASGTTKLRCLAVAMTLHKGVGTLDALALESPRLSVLGGGSVDLGAEQLAVQLRPMLRLGGGAGAPAIVVPVRLGGSFLDPTPKVGGADKSAGGIPGAGLADPCPFALAAVIGAPAAGAGKPAAPVSAPVSGPVSAPGGKPKPQSPLDVLKELIR